MINIKLGYISANYICLTSIYTVYVCFFVNCKKCWYEISITSIVTIIKFKLSCHILTLILTWDAILFKTIKC